MKIGLAGLPMSGKTTIFNMATRAQAQVRDFLAQSDEVNTGVIKVPDARLDYLTGIFKPKKTIHATVEFTDIPGVSKDEKGFSSKTLANIRICEALMLVIRVFGGSDVPHVHDQVDPAADLEELLLEFVFSDLEIVQNKIERAQKEMKAGKKPELLREVELMERLKKALESNQLISSLDISAEDEALMRGFRFLTQKPVMLVGNCSEDQLKNASDPNVAKFTEACAKHGWPSMLIAGKTEMEISGLSGRDRLIREAYRVLNYISFLTVGEDEVRAWPLQKETRAQKAAGRIHSDIERGFIRAEVVAYKDFVEKGGMAGVKQAGLMRLEGKEYLVEDGDIINFRFNV